MGSFDHAPFPQASSVAKKVCLPEPIFADEKRHLRVLHETATDDSSGHRASRAERSRTILVTAASIQSMLCTDDVRGLGRDQQAAYQPSGNGTSGQGDALSLAARGEG